jgi:hypothetical protein
MDISAIKVKFLDEVSKFMQLLFMVKLLFCCKKSCVLKHQERNISASSSHKVIFVQNWLIVLDRVRTMKL